MTVMASRDPRSSSSQSLVPDPASENTYRRKLLLVYVHGFMGDETSFRSFPAHVHNVVTVTLSDSHAVHTKIYPKYRPRYALDIARDDFSKWLEPHETPWTDVILLGHSMGGLLASDIALVFRHNIIGVINFDVPFLGMHPGIVKAGLASLFNPAPAPTDAPVTDSEERKPSRMNTLFNPKPSDPNFNPTFYNDVHLPVRKGWENALHWMNKHSNGIINASKGLVKSHIEFGGSMADYKELKDRYARIRALEEDNPNKRRAANPEGQTPPRIRFLNYYTASTGRPKKPKSPKSPSPSRPSSQGPDSRHGSTINLSNSRHGSTSNVSDIRHESIASITESGRESAESTPTGSLLDLTHVHPEPMLDTSPRISVEEHRGDQIVPVTPQDPLSATTPKQEVPHLEHHQSTQSSGPELPEIPPIPKEPAFVDLAQYPDKAERRAAEKEHSRALQEYQKAVKARNKVIKERSKIEEKWQKQSEKEAKEAQKESTPSHHHHHHHDNSTPAATDATSPPPPNHAPRPSSPSTATISSDLSSMQLGTINSRPTSHIPHSPYATYDFSHSTIMSAPNPSDQTSLADSSNYTDSLASLTPISSPTVDPNEPPKKKKFKKFCLLPPKDAVGNKDPTWVRVTMQDVDAVTAHTSLFFMSESYEMLVGDVAGRVEEWVRENESERVVREMGGE